ncbi:MAG: sialidase family protein [Chthoniobacter sp.]|nr:sialidase family protein [Chthoniobacter sp.]
MKPFTVAFLALAASAFAQQPPGYTIPVIDLANETARQTLVDREAGQYLGHVTTVLLEDGKTILAVYPKNHGRGAIVYKRSTDGGLTWSDRLPTPKSWETSLEVPTIHRVIDAAGKKRLILFSRLYPIRMSVSEDDGATWSELQPIGKFGGIVAMASVMALKQPGHYLAFFHDDGRFLVASEPQKVKGLLSDYTALAAKEWRFWVYQTRSSDGGLTWSVPAPIASLPDAKLCEPGAVRSPDGQEIAVLLRENSRKHNSYLITSRDEGLSWSEPRELPAALTGDRHTAKYAPDGRLFITFRDETRQSSTKGDWVAWVGKYEDLVAGREGQYRVRLMHNTKSFDCAYPGLEVLPDGTIVTTTYGHWEKDQPPYIMSVRLKLAELDAKAPK